MENNPRNISVIILTMATLVSLIYIIFVSISLIDTVFYILRHEKIIPAHNFDLSSKYYAGFEVFVLVQ
jgi:uncharacterized protein (UPF0248 family)